jgi:hypothetical protein
MQLSLLGIEQEIIYNSRKVLKSSTTIRWGSQYNVAKSLDDSKEAPRNFDDVEFSGTNNLTLTNISEARGTLESVIMFALHRKNKPEIIEIKKILLNLFVC